MKKTWGAPLLVTALTAGALVLATAPARTADHRDGPIIQQDQPADIADVYAFVNPNNSNIVLAMTVNPYTVPGVAAVFSPDVLHQIHIDNSGDARDDLVIQASFDSLAPNQTVTIRGPGRPRGNKENQSTLLSNNAGALSGPANNNQLLTGKGLTAFVGRRDDPFFVDLIFVRSVLGVGPAPARPAGRDLFAGLNVSVIAVEVPAKALRGSDGDTIRVWATTSRPKNTKLKTNRDPRFNLPWIQVDRMGLPAINTALIGAARKEDFNRATPADDRRLFRSEVITRELQLNGGNQAHAEAVADFVLPDVLTLDMTSLGGFPNGRRPQDDVIDVELNLLSNGAVVTDNVPVNDVPFLTNFPFFAPEHQPSETIPPRD